jgi:hypothetical protein
MATRMQTGRSSVWTQVERGKRFVFSKMSRLVWGPPSLLCSFSPSPISSTNVKSEWSYTPASPVSLHGTCRYSFTFTFTQIITLLIFYFFINFVYCFCPLTSTLINPSAWSDEHCSSCCTVSLIRLYLDNIGRKCNPAALNVFTKELALLWCGRQFLQIIASFFPLLLNFWFSFCSP